MEVAPEVRRDIDATRQERDLRDKQVLQEHLAKLPDSATPSDYERLPVHEFGRTFVDETAPYVPFYEAKPRPFRLGLGAKPLDEVLQAQPKRQQQQQPQQVQEQEPWLFNQIKVRVVSPNSRNHRMLGTVVDVISPASCDVLLEGTRELLQAVPQDQLEAVVPGQGMQVLAVRGQHRGLRGRLLEVRGSSAVVLLENFDVLEFELDQLGVFDA